MIMLDDLYREVILDHYRNPRHRHEIELATGYARAHNPVCGDEVKLQVRVADGVIQDAGFLGNGCSISQASASMMTDHVIGKSQDEALAIADQFQDMMHGGPAPDEDDELAALAGVRKFPARVKCAMLGWQALRETLGKPFGS